MEANRKIMGENIQFYMDKFGLNRKALAKNLDVPYSSLTCWINGNTYPRIDKIELMANYFKIDKSALVESASTKKEIRGIRIPIYKKIIFGLIEDSIDNIDGFEEIPESWAGDYYALKINDDSMSPNINEGNTVIIKEQDAVQTGDIVAATINKNDTVIRRLQEHPDGILLQPFNPKYEILFFSSGTFDISQIQIWGKVVENRQKY